MKPKIILVGGGGHCISCIDVIEQEGRFDIAGVVDSNKKLEQILGYKILGGDEDLFRLRKIYDCAFVTVGQIKTPATRMRLFNQLSSLDFKLPVIISPRAYVSRHANICEGSIIMHNALINAAVDVGKNCIINTKAIVEHESKIGNHCHISTGSIINGGVTIGHGTFIGSNSVVTESVKINENFFIRAGSLFSGAGDE